MNGREGVRRWAPQWEPVQPPASRRAEWQRHNFVRSSQDRILAAIVVVASAPRAAGVKKVRGERRVRRSPFRRERGLYAIEPGEASEQVSVRGRGLRDDAPGGDRTGQIDDFTQYISSNKTNIAILSIILDGFRVWYYTVRE